MSINISTINTSVNMPVCLSKKDIQTATQEDAHPQEIKAYIIQGWQYKKEDLENSMKDYWLKRSKLVMINCITMKGERIITSFQLQKQILQQLHNNHIGIEKWCLFTCISVQEEYEYGYWEYCQTVCYILRISANITMWEDNNIWYTVHTMGGAWCWYIFYK